MVALLRLLGEIHVGIRFLNALLYICSEPPLGKHKERPRRRIEGHAVNLRLPSKCCSNVTLPSTLSGRLGMWPQCQGAGGVPAHHLLLP